MYLVPQPKIIEMRPGILPLEHKPYSDFVTESITPRLSEKESYRITIDNGSILLEGADKAGLFRGKITLKQIALNYKGHLPNLYIYDEPVYRYRGFMLDPCRHFFSVDEIKKMIDAAAFFKFNRFHFHLSDDQGFRCEIESWEKLTSVGSVRSGSNFGRGDNISEPYGGYYTKEELKDIVNYCHERYIKVIPEFDLPGHTTAVLAAYPELSCKGLPIEPETRAGIFPDILCAGNPNTERMIKDVISELCEIFTDDYFHIGGDEVPKIRWDNCPKCKARKEALGLNNMEELQGVLINDMAAFLKSKGKKAICWNDALKGHNLDRDNLTVSVWMEHNKNTSEWANSGGSVIVESFNPYYVDYPLGMHTLYNCYNFNPESFQPLTAIGKKNIKGIETPAWTEYITSFKKLSSLCFPRWLAIADTAWNGNSHKDYARFLTSCEFFCEYLREQGHFPAPKEEWNQLPHKRLKGTLGFFKNLLTGDMIKRTITGESHD